MTELGPMTRRALSRGELGLSLAIGIAVFVLAAAVLSPWPELLGAEAATLGRTRWHWEFFKSAVPPLAAGGAWIACVLVMQRCSRRRK